MVEYVPADFWLALIVDIGLGEIPLQCKIILINKILQMNAKYFCSKITHFE